LAVAGEIIIPEGIDHDPQQILRGMGLTAGEPRKKKEP
jgi:hypothetical protein